MLESINKFIEATEGLEVSFKMGKESELVIKGDFITMAKLAAKLADASSKDDIRESKIRELKEEIKQLQS